MKPHVCPVCFGRGFVEPHFYSAGCASTSANSPEKCRTCLGTGMVWEVTVEEIQAQGYVGPHKPQDINKLAGAEDHFTNLGDPEDDTRTRP